MSIRSAPADALPGAIRAGRPSLRLHLLALACYGLFAFLTLHPLIFHNGARVAGFDYFNYNWNFWWIRHALTTPGLDPYLNDFVFFPALNNFGYHALTAFWFPLWALVEPVAGTLTAVNVIIVAGCVLNGYLLFALLRREDVPPGLALIGGAALQLTPLVRYFYYNTHLNLMDWFWLPAQILLWGQVARAVAGRRWRAAGLWAVAQGISLWGLLLTDLQFPIFVAFLLVPYGLITLWRSQARAALIAAGLVAVGVGFALMWFAGPLPYILQFEGTLAPGAVEDRPGVPFPRGYLAVDPVWWYWNVPTLGGFVTVAALAALAASLTRARRVMSGWRWLWLALAIPPLLLSMGPQITVFGVEIPMPFRLLYAQTDGMFGMPWRLAPIYLVAALVFAGLTFAPLLRRIGPWRLPALTAALLLLFASLRVFQTAPLDPALPVYDFYAAMGRETGPPYDEYVVIEVPTGVGTGEVLIGDERAISFQFYGMIHGKRMVNGFVSRAPVEHFWPIRTDDPLLSWLGQRRNLEPEVVEAQLRRIIPEWPVGYVVVHQDVIGRETVANQEILGFLNGLPDLLCPLWREGDALAYRTTWHPDGCPPRVPAEVEPGVYEIDLGAPDDVSFIGAGWSWAEALPGVTARWAVAESAAHLHLDLPPGCYELALGAQSFEQARTLRVAANGAALGEALIAPDSLATYTFTLPAAVLDDGRAVHIALAYDAPGQTPAEADPDAARALAVLVDAARFSPCG